MARVGATVIGDKVRFEGVRVRSDKPTDSSVAIKFPGLGGPTGTWHMNNAIECEVIGQACVHCGRDPRDT